MEFPGSFCLGSVASSWVAGEACAKSSVVLKNPRYRRDPRLDSFDPE